MRGLLLLLLAFYLKKVTFWPSFVFSKGIQHTPAAARGQHPVHTELSSSHFPLCPTSQGAFQAESSLPFVLAAAVSEAMSSLRAQGNGLARNCS